MISIRKITLYGIVLLATASAQQQSAILDGIIEGLITDAAGAPLKKASVGLENVIRSNPPRVRAAEIGAGGSFIFRDVTPGTYVLIAQRNGYLRADGGERFSVAAGQHLTGISIRMAREGMISGTVTDEDGEPFPNATVSVEGVSGTVSSRADGSFVIGGLPTGSYFVSASEKPRPAGRNQRDLPAHAGPREFYVTTYYPSALDRSKATKVKVDAGSQAGGLEIRLQKMRLVRIAGKAVDATTGAPAAHLALTLFEVPDSESTRSGRPVNFTTLADGTFAFERLLPARYMLQTSDASAEHPMAGYRTIEVGADGVENLEFKVSPALELTGKVTKEDGSPIPEVSVQLSPPWPFFGQAVGVRQGLNRSAADGSIVVRGLMPLPNGLLVGDLPPGAYLKSIRFGGEDVNGRELDLTAGVKGATLEIILGSNPAKSQ